MKARHERALTRRVLAYLQRAEDRESNPHFQDDYRIAWVTTLYASTGVPSPHVNATIQVLGLHPDKIWPAIEARRRAKLGNAYGQFFAENFFDGASSPKKPVQSVRLTGNNKRGRQA